jgi:hypothetical protein
MMTLHTPCRDTTTPLAGLYALVEVIDSDNPFAASLYTYVEVSKVLRAARLMSSAPEARYVRIHDVDPGRVLRFENGEHVPRNPEYQDAEYFAALDRIGLKKP